MIDEAFINSGDSAVRSADVIICIICIIIIFYNNIKFLSPVLDPKLFQISDGSWLINASTVIAAFNNKLSDIHTEL